MTATEETNNATIVEDNTTKTPHTRHIITLVAGDALAFLAFAAIGRNTHGEPVGLAVIPQIIQTAAPFAIAWFIVAPFAGAYRRDLVTNPRKMAKRTAIAWLLSWPVAMALRGIFVDHGIPPYTFALITLVFNTAILLIWRWPYALNNSIKKREQASK